MKKAAEYLLIFIMIQFVSLTLANGVTMLKGGQVGEDIVGTAIGMNIATLILVIAVYIVWFRSITFSTEYFKTKPVIQLLCCAVLGIATIIPSMFIQKMMPGLTDSNEELFKGMIASPMGFVVLVIAGPLTEEIVFRGAILKALSQHTGNKWMAIIISALAFAVIHFNPSQLVHSFLIGILLAWVCLKTKSIVPCIMIHMINNGTVYLSLKYFPEVSFTSVPLLLTASVLTIISLLGIIRSTRQ